MLAFKCDIKGSSVGFGTHNRIVNQNNSVRPSHLFSHNLKAKFEILKFTSAWLSKAARK